MTINRQSVLDAINRLEARGTALTPENIQASTNVSKPFASQCLAAYLADRDEELAEGTDFSKEVRSTLFAFTRTLRGNLEQQYGGAMSVQRREFEALLKSQASENSILENRIAEQALALRDAHDAALSDAAEIERLRLELAASEEARKAAQSRLADLMVVQDQQVLTETTEDAAPPSALAACQDRLRIIEAKLHDMNPSSSLARWEPQPRAAAAATDVDDRQMELEDAIDRAVKRDTFVASDKKDDTPPSLTSDPSPSLSVGEPDRRAASEAERNRPSERLWNSGTLPHDEDEAISPIDEPMPKYPRLPSHSSIAGPHSYASG